jgi:hypothetical protein
MMGTAGGQTPKPSPIPPDLAREAYELYSSIFRGMSQESRYCDFLKSDELLVISNEVLQTPNNDVVKTMKPKSSEDRLMIGKLVQLGKTRYAWEERFDFGRPYRLLSEADDATLDDCKFRGFAGRPNDPKCAAFVNVRVGRALSLPSFNKDHTRALVRFVRGCGFLCGGDEFASYRKTASGWKREQPGFGGCAIY